MRAKSALWQPWQVQGPCGVWDAHSHVCPQLMGSLWLRQPGAVLCCQDSCLEKGGGKTLN